MREAGREPASPDRKTRSTDTERRHVGGDKQERVSQEVSEFR